MKCIIAGCRTCTDYATLLAALRSCPFTSEITHVISGGARGADTLGEQWATRNKIPCTRHVAQWAMHGAAAGPIRNKRMAESCLPGRDGLIALWDGKSRGTYNMIENAIGRNLRVFVWDITRGCQYEEKDETP